MNGINGNTANGISANGSDDVTLFTTDNCQLSCVATQSIADKFATLSDDDKDGMIGSLRVVKETLNVRNPCFFTFIMSTDTEGCWEMVLRGHKTDDSVFGQKIEFRVVECDFGKN